MPQPIIAWDYQFAPNAQKARNLLHAANVPYEVSEQPFVLPRPILTDLGVTYRRVPVWSFGKDMYVDNRAIIDAFQKLYPSQALPTSAADHAYEQFGYKTFWVGLSLVPADFVTKDLAKDRETLFAVFSRPDFASLRQNALAEMRCLLDIVETEFLAHGGPWINGKSCGVADIHAMWIIKWCLQTLGVDKEPGFSKKDFPRVYAWVEGLPAHTPDTEPQKLEPKDAHQKILNADYTAKDIGVDANDPLGFKAGDKISVETSDDAKPDAHPQVGKLVGLNKRELVLELDNTVRMHYPRVGYVVRKA